MDLDGILLIDSCRDMDELINFSDAGKSEIESLSNRHLTQSRLQITGCTAERYSCLLRVVAQGPGSFCSPVNFVVRRAVDSYGASNLPNFRILAYFPIQNA